MVKPKILIVDDERPTRDAMARILSRSYRCLTAADAELAMAAIRDNPDLALLLTDYKMPGDNGIELIRKAKRAIPSLGAILITAFGEIELAVEAMKEGADDFLTKPITDIDQLEMRVAKAIGSRDETPPAPSGKAAANALADFTGTSPAMERVYWLIRKVAPSDATVLIGGPSGSGKELAARAIHSLSRRAARPFIAVECSAFSGDLLKSELFGYEPGTFTGGLKDGKAGCFEDAAGGTLFLDEIGEIDMATQIALLRTLETKSVRRIGGTREKPVDFRLVAATNRDLPKMVVDGTFREDLFYRLNIIGIQMPPLKEHRDDIAPLAERFLREFARGDAARVRAISPEALRVLESYSWPGNVRQLRNVLERMVVLATGETLTVDDLPPELTDPAPIVRPAPQNAADTTAASIAATAATTPPSAQPTSCSDSLAQNEKTRILAVLEQCNGNKSKAAERLGISRRTIHRKLNEWKTESTPSKD